MGKATAPNPSLNQPGTSTTSPGATGMSPNAMPDDDAIPPNSSGRIER
jgi:hypothetical protein